MYCQFGLAVGTGMIQQVRVRTALRVVQSDAETHFLGHVFSPPPAFLLDMMEDIVTFDATYRCIAMILPLSYVAGNKCDTLFEASCAMYEADPAFTFFSAS